MENIGFLSTEFASVPIIIIQILTLASGLYNNNNTDIDISICANNNNTDIDFSLWPLHNTEPINVTINIASVQTPQIIWNFSQKKIFALICNFFGTENQAPNTFWIFALELFDDQVMNIVFKPITQRQSHQ